MNFSSPTPTVWVKVNGDITEGLLTSNLDHIPAEHHPKLPTIAKRGYKRLFCLQRQRWVALYTRLILSV